MGRYQHSTWRIASSAATHTTASRYRLQEPAILGLAQEASSASAVTQEVRGACPDKLSNQRRPWKGGGGTTRRQPVWRTLRSAALPLASRCCWRTSGGPGTVRAAGGGEGSREMVSAGRWGAGSGRSRPEGAVVVPGLPEAGAQGGPRSPPPWAGRGCGEGRGRVRAWRELWSVRSPRPPCSVGVAPFPPQVTDARQAGTQTHSPASQLAPPGAGSDA